MPECPLYPPVVSNTVVPVTVPKIFIVDWLPSMTFPPPTKWLNSILLYWDKFKVPFSLIATFIFPFDHDVNSFTCNAPWFTVNWAIFFNERLETK